MGIQVTSEECGMPSAVSKDSAQSWGLTARGEGGARGMEGRAPPPPPNEVEGQRMLHFRHPAVLGTNGELTLFETRVQIK